MNQFWEKGKEDCRVAVNHSPGRWWGRLVHPGPATYGAGPPWPWWQGRFEDCLIQGLTALSSDLSMTKGTENSVRRKLIQKLSDLSSPGGNTHQLLWIQYWFCAWHCVNLDYIVPDLILTTVLWGRHYYSSYFSHKDTFHTWSRYKTCWRSDSY